MYKLLSMCARDVEQTCPETCVRHLHDTHALVLNTNTMSGSPLGINSRWNVLVSCVGKTTLINHILSQDHGRRVAVIENEYGEIGIDNSLIVGKENLEGDGDLTILENGCLCCTVRDDLVKALNGLVKRGGFDHVLVETTGAVSFLLE
jgi:uncharacterized protein YuzB (UPF0349 family)